MTALAHDRNAPRLGEASIPLQLSWPQKASTTIYAGALVVSNAGYAAPGTTATGLVALGVAPCGSANAGSNGAKTVAIEQGIFPFANSASTDAIAQSDAGSDCYIVDDQTVAKTDGSSTRSRAGKIVGLDAAGNVLVLVGLAV